MLIVIFPSTDSKRILLKPVYKLMPFAIDFRAISMACPLDIWHTVASMLLTSKESYRLVLSDLSSKA